MPGFMRSSENKILPDIVSRQQLRIKGLEQTIDMGAVKFKASVTRENILSNELFKERKENIELQYTLKQLKIKCEEYEKALAPKLSYPIFEPSSSPRVQWVAYSDFLKCMNSLEARLNRAENRSEKHDDGQ